MAAVTAGNRGGGWKGVLGAIGAGVATGAGLFAAAVAVPAVQVTCGAVVYCAVYFTSWFHVRYCYSTHVLIN